MVDWPSILREHGPLVWRTAYRLLNHDADAHDCFQRTFVAAVALAEKESVSHWPALLKRLATARGLEALRTRLRERNRREPLPDDLADPSLDSPSFTAGHRELEGRLRDALAEIDPNQAEVFCLVCLEGLSNREAAAALGIRADHLGVMLHRARQALRGKLAEFAPITPEGKDPS